ncbi:MAG: metal-dependent transcriptional regulator [Pseudonocardia sp.]|nr:metal-dependent transcriptional regulator [Pseudonocardia sp.]
MRGRYSSSIEDYLKAIYALQERGTAAITTTRLAERLGVLPSSASGMVRKLSELALLEHRRYGSITLTESGRKVALGVVRRHRLIELYLVAELGYTWDEVHDEAEVLEHAVSDRLLDRIAERLDDPRVDPHGDPIPTRDGEIAPCDAQRLSTSEPGCRGQLVRVDDADPGMLRHLSARGICLGTMVELVERAPYGGSYVVKVHGVPAPTVHHFGPELVDAMWVRAERE